MYHLDFDCTMVYVVRILDAEFFSDTYGEIIQQYVIKLTDG